MDEKSRPIRKVLARKAKGQRVQNIKLFDANDNVIDFYNHGGLDDDYTWHDYELLQNEQLVGFYGSGISGRCYF